MKKIILLIIIANNYIFAQESPDSLLQTLFNQNKFDEIITTKSNLNIEDLSSNSLYYIGYSYFRKESYESAIRYLDKAIEKTPVTCNMYLFKMRCLELSNKNDEALKVFDDAVNFDSTYSLFYAEKGHLYLTLNKENDAIEYFQKSLAFPVPQGISYYFLGKIYHKKEGVLSGLNFLYEGLKNVDTIDDYYPLMLFRVSQYEFELKNYNNTIKFVHRFNQFPLYKYDCWDMLIQSYVELNNLDSAKVYRELLYNEFKEKKLPQYLKDEFCFDKFFYKGKYIEAFERFQDEGKEGYPKHTFYVYDSLKENSKLLFTIQTERVLNFLSNGEYDYTIGKGYNSPDSIYYHETYFYFKFKEPVSYIDLKKTVLQILDGKAIPTSASKSTKKAKK